jgi:riboflavin synthase
MFTGIVTGLGKVAAIERRRGGLRLSISPPAGYGRFAPGESVSVSGVCLTAVAAGRGLVADLSTETLRCSRLGRLSEGDAVNLERALRWGDRLSGHFVMGHVDGTVRLCRVARAGNSWTFTFQAPRDLSRFVVAKGSVALDGVSLTVAARRGNRFDVAVIPETHRRTTLGTGKPGDTIHFEADVFARYGRAAAMRRVCTRGRRR